MTVGSAAEADALSIDLRIHFMDRVFYLRRAIVISRF